MGARYFIARTLGVLLACGLAVALLHHAAETPRINVFGPDRAHDSFKQVKNNKGHPSLLQEEENPKEISVIPIFAW